MLKVYLKNAVKLLVLIYLAWTLYLNLYIDLPNKETMERTLSSPQAVKITYCDNKYNLFPNVISFLKANNLRYQIKNDNFCVFYGVNDGDVVQQLNNLMSKHEFDSQKDNILNETKNDLNEKTSQDWFSLNDDIGDIILRFPKEFEMSTFSSGNLNETIIISKGESLHKEFYDLLNNRGDWTTDINSYAPNILLESKLLTINLLDTVIIINYTLDEGKNWKQKSSRTTNKYIGQALIKKLK